MKRYVIIPVLLALLFISLAGCVKHSSEQIRVVATTSLIGSMVRAVGGEKVELTIIVPSGMCPGHFDVKPGDIVNLSDANLILYHGWEKWMDKLASHEDKSNRVKINAAGNSMVPDIHIKATKLVTDALCKADPTYCDLFRDNMKKYEEAINSAVEEMKGKTSNLEGTKIICAKMQEGFLTWVGFDIAATYGRPEEITPSEMVRVVNLAKTEKVELFVDNLQSGPEAGLTMAEEVGARHVALTNFPLGKTWDSYVVSLKENINKLP